LLHGLTAIGPPRQTQPGAWTRRHGSGMTTNGVLQRLLGHHTTIRNLVDNYHRVEGVGPRRRILDALVGLLETHMGVEEILYAVVARLDEDAEILVEELRGDHEIIRELLDDVERAMVDPTGQGFRAGMAALVARLDEHLQLEERRLYPLAVQRLPAIALGDVE